MSRAGIASRRAAEEMIRQGRVQVNGETVTRLGTTADPYRDRITVDGRLVDVTSTPRLYFLLHKPVGVVSTLKDPQGRPTVRELLKGVRERVFPVGRLDYHSAGLLLLTNDGELAERLLHPRSQLPRTYHVKIAGHPTPQVLRTLRSGVRLEDGTLTAPARVRILRVSERKTWLEMTLQEGRNREVRRMWEAVGYEVEKLIRVRFGPLVLADLPPGGYRPLQPAEIRALKRAVA
ncbi:MAG: rRNA pseudouridine synthase [Candidatus Binatia bacterium]|nr:rRNA pseudouridine synthase [Candidatus Binatia bacterium]